MAGELEGGMPAWSRAGGPVASIPLVTPNTVGATRVLDVRQDAEFAAGHAPGAEHIELGELAEGAGEPPEGPAVVMCGHGERAMSAASLLARGGRRDIAVLEGGPQDLDVVVIADDGTGGGAGAGGAGAGGGAGSARGARSRNGR